MIPQGFLSPVSFVRSKRRVAVRKVSFFSLQLILEEADGFALRALTRAEFYFSLFAFLGRHMLTWGGWS